MIGGIGVLLPARAAHLAQVVVQAGCTPVVDATGGTAPHVPEGAWVRTRPGRPAPGSGPVILADLGAPVPGRPTWLESAVPRAVPQGYAGIVLKGREAGGLCGEEDGLLALSRCPEPGRVVLDAGVGPDTAAAAAALGAAGVLLVEPHLGCTELGLPAALARRLRLPADELTHVVQGIRVANSPSAPVLRELVRGGDPWALSDGLFESGDPLRRLWMAGQGLALAAELADRHQGLAGLLAAYAEAWASWAPRVRSATSRSAARPAQTVADLAVGDVSGGVGASVGSAVLWQAARFAGRPVAAPPELLRAAMAVGSPVVAEPSALDAVRAELPAQPSSSSPPASVPAVPTSEPLAPVDDGPRSAIAIIGIGCVFPGQADSAEAFWQNIVNGRNCIGPVPKDRWDPDLYFDTDREAPDRTYTTIGSFLDGFVFEPKRFRIPPKVASQVDPVQQITLTAVAGALKDAGLKVDSRDAEGRAFDRARCAVILGNSLGGEVGDQYAIRLAWPEVERQLQSAPSFQALPPELRLNVRHELESRYKAGLPEITEDSMPGELANVISGRITNAFDLGGANFTR
jgi:hypothetical protein